MKLFILSKAISIDFLNFLSIFLKFYLFHYLENLIFFVLILIFENFFSYLITALSPFFLHQIKFFLLFLD